MEKKSNYFAESGFDSIISQDNEEKLPQIYETHDWIFIWAEDFKGRIFWILFSRSIELGGQGALAAVGPPEFARFIQDIGKEAIIATLTLINNSKKMNSVAIVVSSLEQAKKTREIRDKMQYNPEVYQFKNWINGLKVTPNIEGQWFPTYKPICPVCNEELVGVTDYKIGFVQMICPKCGFKKRKQK